MSDFLTRMAQRSLGLAPLAEAVPPALFAADDAEDTRPAYQLTEYSDGHERSRQERASRQQVHQANLPSPTAHELETGLPLRSDTLAQTNDPFIPVKPTSVASQASSPDMQEANLHQDIMAQAGKEAGAQQADPSSSDRLALRESLPPQQQFGESKQAGRAESEIQTRAYVPNSELLMPEYTENRRPDSRTFSTHSADAQRAARPLIPELRGRTSVSEPPSNPVSPPLPDVRISIGRVEVRAHGMNSAAGRMPVAMPREGDREESELSLDEYLKRGSGGR